MVRSSLIRRRLNTISIFRPLDGEPKTMMSSTYADKQNMIDERRHLGHDSPGSRSGCSTASARWATAAGWSGAAAPPPVGQTAPAGSPQNKPEFILVLCNKESICNVPECQKGSSGVSRCTGTSCCGSGSW